MRKPRHTAPAADVERLDAALKGAHPSTPEDADMVRIARALTARQPSRDAARAATKARMLRAFALADNEPTRGAGTRDGSVRAAREVYTAEIKLPDGGRVLMADVEHIDAARAEASSAGVYLPSFEVVPDEML